MRRLCIGLISLGMLTLLQAQTGGGSTGGAGGGTTGGTGGAGGTTGGGNTGIGGNTSRQPIGVPQQQQQMPQMPQTIFLSGKVMLDDGTPPPEPVTIERVCSGQPRPEGYTDSKGRFSFQLGQKNNGMLMDASTSNHGGFGDPFDESNSSRGLAGLGGNSAAMGGSRLMLMGCELRAVLPGYQSSIIPLANRNPLDNPEVGTIILKRLGNREGSVFSATNAMAPKDAKKALEKGRELLKKGKKDDAAKELQKAVDLYPKYSSAWYELGRVHEEQGNVEAAKNAYNQSLAADSKYLYPYQKLFMIAANEQKWDEVADTTGKLLKLNPFDFPNAYYYNAVANFNLKKFDEAEKSAKNLYDQDPKRFARAGYIWGLTLAQREDFSGAAERLKKYLELAPAGGDVDTVRKQLAEIEKFASAKNPE